MKVGVVPGAISAVQASTLRGRVITTAGAALPGAVVTVLGHPELGSTKSRVDGWYDLAAIDPSGHAPGQAAELPLAQFMQTSLILIAATATAHALAIAASSPVPNAWEFGRWQRKPLPPPYISLPKTADPDPWDVLYKECMRWAGSDDAARYEFLKWLKGRNLAYEAISIERASGLMGSETNWGNLCSAMFKDRNIGDAPNWGN